MKISEKRRIDKRIAILMIGLLALAFAGCGKGKEVTPVSAESKSGIVFGAGYAEMIQEEFNMVFADAQDGSYMLSMEVLERPGEWTWQEVLIQCGNANVEEFILAGISFYEWQTMELPNGQMEYLSVEEGETLYSVGVVALKDAHYGVMLYGNFGEEILLQIAKEIESKESGFEIELSGTIQNITLSNRGKSLENYKVLYFENDVQAGAYLDEMAKGLKLKQIKDGKEISLAGNGGTAIGLGKGADGENFFAGQGQGSVACYGVIELANDKGMLLIEYTSRSREEQVESLPKHLEMLGKFFRSKTM